MRPRQTVWQRVVAAGARTAGYEPLGGDFWPIGSFA